MPDLSDKTVREIVLAMPTTTFVFEEFEIDYFCDGNRLFDEACQIAGIDSEIVTRRMEEKLANTAAAGDFIKIKSASGLVDYIVEKHHGFTRKEVVRLSALMEEVCLTHGADCAELFDLAQVLNTLCNDLFAHMKKEEAILFPHIKDLETAALDGSVIQPESHGSVSNQSRMLRWEHLESSNMLKKMRKISSDYTLPKTGCPVFAALYLGLQRLELDLHQHIHLENNILFPLASEIDAKLSCESEKI